MAGKNLQVRVATRKICDNKRIVIRDLEPQGDVWRYVSARRGAKEFH